MSSCCDDIRSTKQLFVPSLVFWSPLCRFSIKRRNHLQKDLRILLLQLQYDLSCKHVHAKRTTRDEMLVALLDEAFNRVMQPLLEIDAPWISLIKPEGHLLGPVASERYTLALRNTFQSHNILHLLPVSLHQNNHITVQSFIENLGSMPLVVNSGDEAKEDRTEEPYPVKAIVASTLLNRFSYRFT